MAYYNGKKIFTKIVINGVPRVCRVVGVVATGKPQTDFIVENGVLNFSNATVTDGVLYADNITVNNGVLAVE